MSVFCAKSPVSMVALALAVGGVLGSAPALAQPKELGAPPEVANFEVTEYSAGPVYLGATVGEAKKAAPNLTFKRGGGPENSIVVDVMQGDRLIMSLFTQEQIEYDDEGNPPPIDDSAIIESIDIFDERFVATGGVHVGMPMERVETALGKLEGMTNLPHMGETPTFSRQPDYLSFIAGPPESSDRSAAGNYERIKDCTSDYAPACQVAKTYVQGAAISSMMISFGSAGPQMITEFTGLPDGYRIIRKVPTAEQCDAGQQMTTYSIWPNYPASSFFTPIEVETGYCPDEYSPITRQAYGDQDSVIVDDFNFDGIPDLALTIGAVGGYGSIAYNIYFYDEPSASHRYSEEFSELTMSLGMFETDTKEGMLFVNSKSGAAWFQREGYRVADDNQLVKVYERTMEFGPSGEGVATTKITMDGQEFTVIEPITE